MTTHSLSFNGADRWVGVLARYQNTDNFLYVTLRSSNRLSLRRLINGQIQIVTEKPYAVTTGAWYTVRVEVVNGITHVFVNNRLELWTMADPGPAVPYPIVPKGQVGLVTYRATAEYDDFLAYQP